MLKKNNHKKQEPTLLDAFTTIEFGNSAINFSLFLVRLVVATFMIKHGIAKIVNFDTLVDHFPNPLNFGSRLSLQTAIVIEIACSIFLLFGFLTRIFLLPLILQMIVLIFFVHIKDLANEGELALLYFTFYILLFFLGPGKFSIDGAIQHQEGHDKLASNDDDM